MCVAWWFLLAVPILLHRGHCSFSLICSVPRPNRQVFALFSSSSFVLFVGSVRYTYRSTQARRSFSSPRGTDFVLGSFLFFQFHIFLKARLRKLGYRPLEKVKLKISTRCILSISLSSVFCRRLVPTLVRVLLLQAFQLSSPIIILQ